VIEHLEHDDARSIDGVEEFRRWNQDLIDRTIAALDGRHFDIAAPLRRCEAMIAPPGGAAAMYYTGPSEDFSRPGRTWYPTLGRTRFPLWREVSICYHEAVPGHHLQVGQVKFLADRLSRYQRAFGFVSGHGEGWALYAERLMAELGYFDDPAWELGMLSAQAMRAVRVVVDIGMHLELASREHDGARWTPELALPFVVERSRFPEDFMRSEVDRYLGWPGQAISYKAGERVWLECRADAQRRLGGAFDLKAFHTYALDLGSMGLATLREELGRFGPPTPGGRDGRHVPEVRGDGAAATGEALAGFEATRFEHGGVARTVYRGGSGPGVVVIHELPGLTPPVAAFGRRLVDAGFTVAMPVLAGTPGRPMSPGYVARSLAGVCVSREFTTWATKRTSPVIEWLRALARDLYRTAGGPGVGAVGMCFSGGFALAMAVDDELRAPVCSQPSLPFPVGAARARDLGLAPDDLARVAARDDLCVMALRFTHDRAVPTARFERLREVFGDRLLAVEIDNPPGNPHGIRRMAHSVLTEDLVDEPGHPTRDALDRVLAFLRERLGA
jgi:dienelactone hydrolase